ncbi:MAG: hypothetical protein KTR26_11595 [Flammeovirgaceae bacterium]|nr:hypothetical protein [Flammeovirgaceae bacterium]
MKIVDEIIEKILDLPEEAHPQVLDYLEYMSSKYERVAGEIPGNEPPSFLEELLLKRYKVFNLEDKKAG